MDKRSRHAHGRKQFRTQARDYSGVSSLTNYEGRHALAAALKPITGLKAVQDAARRRRLTAELAAERVAKKRKLVDATSTLPSPTTHLHHHRGRTSPTPTTPEGDLDDATRKIGCPLQFSSEAESPPGMVSEEEEPYGGSATSDVRVVQRRLRSFLSWDKLLSYLCIAGTVQFSAVQYGIISAALRTANEHIRLRTYKTVRTTMWPHILDVCFPKSCVMHVRDLPFRTPSHAKHAKVKTINAGMRNPQNCVRIVMPSEWAKIDVACYNFYSDVYEHPRRTDLSFLSIENSLLVRQRAEAIGHRHAMWATVNDSLCPCMEGDAVRFPCVERPAAIKGTSISSHGWSVQSADGDVQNASKVTIGGCIGAMWCVTADDAEPDMSTHSHVDLTIAEGRVYSMLKKPSRTTHECRGHNETTGVTASRRRQTTLPQLASGCTVDVYPGDIIAFIRPDSSPTPRGTMCIFIGSVVRHATGHAAERLVWVNSPSTNGALKELVSVSVNGLPIWCSSNGTVPEGPTLEQGVVRRDKGFLPGGEPYVVYRMALYSDGFKQFKSLSDTRSVGGCYMMPLGLSMENRKSAASARVLTLVPHGHDENDVLRLCIDDIVNATIQGVLGFDPYGRKVRIFIDAMSFFGDYPAAAACADVKGHIATAFCTHCTIMKRRRPTGSQIVYTSDALSRRLGYARTDMRMKAIRYSCPPEPLRKALGLRCSTGEEARALFCVNLADSLRRTAGPARDDGGYPVVPVTFESSLSAAAVPDHLLTGLTKCVLRLCFDVLKGDEKRGELELRITASVSSNGLPTQRNILRWEKSGKYAGLTSMTMTDLLCVLFCAAPIFRQEYSRTRNAAHLMPEKLQAVVAQVYWWPCPDYDGSDPDNCSENGVRLGYYGHLNRLAINFVKSANALVQDGTDKDRVLDKPNTHRLLELCMHSVPNFGHARNCSELTLELVHRTFKDWLECNTHPDSHLTAVERAFAKDWLGRMYVLYQCWDNGDRFERSRSELGLRRLLLGEEGLRFEDNSEAGAATLRDFRAALKDSFREPVLSMMRDCGHVNIPRSRSHEWEAMHRYDQTNFGSRTAMMEQGLNILRTAQGAAAHFEFFKIARYVSVDRYTGRRRAYAENIIGVGDALSAVLAADVPSADDILECASTGNRGIRFFVVVGVVKGEQDHVWAIVKEMIRQDGTYRSTSSSVQVLRLGHGVRRVGLIHQCDDCCTFDRVQNKAKHSSDALHGGAYHVFARRKGYPPHMG